MERENQWSAVGATQTVRVIAAGLSRIRPTMR